MIIIFSKENISTDYLIDYFNQESIEVIRIDENYNSIALNDILLSNSNNSVDLSVNSKKINLNQVNEIVVKNGNFNFIDQSITITNYQLKDLFFLNSFITDVFLEEEYKPIFGFKNRKFLKLEYLYYCTKLNIKIPDTLVTNNKNTLISFIDKHKSIIKKPIQENLSNKKNQIKELNLNAVKRMNNIFSYSLFQNKIQKSFEIRAFYLMGNFYCGAVFDLANNIDVRSSLSKNQYIIVPYVLPNQLTNKLLKLLRKLKVNTSSLDILVDNEGSHYLVDVTPNGIYSWLSNKCNYNLEYEIKEKIKGRNKNRTFYGTNYC